MYSIYQNVTITKNSIIINYEYPMNSDRFDDYDNHLHINKLYIKSYKCPANLYKFVYLNELELSKCNLNKIPDDVFLLVGLRDLRLCNNNISYIPNKIALLINLEHLNMEGNKLTRLSKNLCNLPKIKYLLFGYNNIIHISKHIYKLKTLSHLLIYHNKLSSFPKCIMRMHSFRTFMIFDNNVNKIPYCKADVLIYMDDEQMVNYTKYIILESIKDSLYYRMTNHGNIFVNGYIYYRYLKVRDLIYYIQTMYRKYLFLLEFYSVY